MDAQEIKDQITELWRRVDRPGVDQLVEFLNNSDFFTAPCSTQFHLAEPGGLAQHSLHVYRLLAEKVKQFGLNISEDSIIVFGLGHDLCKVDCYKIGGEPCSDAQYNYLSSLWSRNRRIRPLIGSGGDLFDSSQDFDRSIPASYATLLIDCSNRPGESCPKLPLTWTV